jgi:rSAM/selenodomain-associated transferase 2/rSAM/selenodomain-associated transferase 1
MKKAIIIFTRIPIPGKTKTRMMPYLTPIECSHLHQCFLKDIKRECEKVSADIFVSYTPENGKESLVSILGEDKMYFPQIGTNLGEKMYQSFQYILKKGYKACVLIGTDVPEIRAVHIKKAFSTLEDKEVVFGPTTDGGYYLVGMKIPRIEVFHKQSYGHEHVMKEVSRHLRNQEITVGYIPKLSDMDVPEDLRNYRERIRINPRLQQTKTGRYLIRTSKISIIIPTYNEETTIVKMQNQLRKLKDKCEIIFVDGGSTDQTLRLISPEFRVLHSQKGRQNQMNMGAKASTGDILFFLHCDSELPEDPLSQIRYVMKDYRVGCFGIAFHSRNFFLLMCRIISNHRVKDRKVIFGDQGIFIDRNLFFEIGMFPNLPIMEDYQLSLTLKERKEKLGMTKERIYTSDRRFPKSTLPKLAVMWQMNRLRKMYRKGADINEIARRYKDIR